MVIVSKALSSPSSKKADDLPLLAFRLNKAKDLAKSCIKFLFVTSSVGASSMKDVSACSSSMGCGVVFKALVKALIWSTLGNLPYRSLNFVLNSKGVAAVIPAIVAARSIGLSLAKLNGYFNLDGFSFRITGFFLFSFSCSISAFLNASTSNGENVKY